MSADNSVQQLKPGPEMDRAVCEALGIAPLPGKWVQPIMANEMLRPQFIEPYPPVSTDRTAMWLVWNALAKLGHTPTISMPGGKPAFAAWVRMWEPDRTIIKFGESAPEALCLAALAALKVTP